LSRAKSTTRNGEIILAEKVVAIVPAYNEEENIGEVVNSLKRAVRQGVISDFIVVANGCTDHTGSKAVKHGAKVIKLIPANKGIAFIEGVKWAQRHKANTIVTIDADAKSFRPNALEQLIAPVEAKLTPMSIGGFFYGEKEMTFFPYYVSGFRAISMKALKPLLAGNKDWISAFTFARYSLEVGLNGKIFGMNYGVFNNINLSENYSGKKEEKEKAIIKASLVPFIFGVKRPIRDNTVRIDVEIAKMHFRERQRKFIEKIEKKNLASRVARLKRMK
jgi:glycosyltransferase involved in cell wall biosynthesis